MRFPKLEEDLTTDVVVIGAGIAGLSTGYNLVKAGKNSVEMTLIGCCMESNMHQQGHQSAIGAGKKVVILDARIIGAGQTGRTTAHLMTWNDDYYYQLEKMFGVETTKLVAESHKQSGLERYRKQPRQMKRWECPVQFHVCLSIPYINNFTLLMSHC